ncbi:5-(carboxyamino)imidazole ribonucleotide synthase [Arsukibacterium tuosuense]|uniref:N5-carboxyaminoimidazole ribonucleotide synthase n=1 Tax=Arsukibacterium tuosuense TaxID=1323745 RepID=A0A285IP04_9GAMM|nr:5-(carboxyamino)imidazole ribonucleotide synthase [Arsukibacterium tuosuense]SNY48816.1 5-(carboxyamino)imidazole ribonucleotide synthase [Arsukibacterium tuosuense]
MKVLVLGAGQLARMMALAGAPLNIAISAYDVNSDAVVHPLTQQQLGSGLANAIADADVITAEFEHIPLPILEQCQQSGKFLPGSDAIQAGGDRRLEKALLTRCGVASASYSVINNEADFKQAVSSLGLPLIFKSALAGYDGKGQWRLKEPTQAAAVWQQMADFLAADSKQAIVVEQFISFNRELSLVGVRAASGEVKVYPLTENHHVNGVLSVSLARQVNEQLQQQAEQKFAAIANGLNYVGVLAIEFFEVNGNLLVNEIAPRVHNSGHWTQQGADVCQFENHLRAVTGMPLGNTELLRPTLMINILGEDSAPAAILSLAGLHIHWYGKAKRPGRKMGHINLSANSLAELKARFAKLIDLLPAVAFPELEQMLGQISD